MPRRTSTVSAPGPKYVGTSLGLGSHWCAQYVHNLTKFDVKSAHPHPLNLGQSCTGRGLGEERGTPVRSASFVRAFPRSLREGACWRRLTSFDWWYHMCVQIVFDSMPCLHEFIMKGISNIVMQFDV